MRRGVEGSGGSGASGAFSSVFLRESLVEPERSRTMGGSSLLSRSGDFEVGERASFSATSF